MSLCAGKGQSVSQCVRERELVCKEGSREREREREREKERERCLKK